jgi:hypothetical protein
MFGAVGSLAYDLAVVERWRAMARAVMSDIRYDDASP